MIKFVLSEIQNYYESHSGCFQIIQRLRLMDRCYTVLRFELNPPDIPIFSQSNLLSCLWVIVRGDL